MNCEIGEKQPKNLTLCQIKIENCQIMSRRIQGRADSSVFPRLNIDFAVSLALPRKEKVKPAGFPPVFETLGLLKKKEDKTNHGKRVSYCLASVGIGNV